MKARPDLRLAHAAGGVLLLGSLLIAAAPAPAQRTAPDSAALVTVLGRDTLALERWVRTPEQIRAEVVVRSPRTTLRRYQLDLAPDGTMRRFEERVYEPGSAEPVRSEVLERSDGQWTRRLTENDSTRSSRVDLPAGVLPFVDLVHWPFELAVARMPATGAATQPLVSGSRAMSFTLQRTGPGQVDIVHPTRGPTGARVDAQGRLLELDAARTTRKVTVTRVPWLDIEAPARRWAAADRAGRGVGELSGRAEEEHTVGQAVIALDYGTPLKRGRAIWGTVVPWGKLWRTGANRATHFSTSRELVLGEPGAGQVVVPAGDYTLFSIPEQDGGVLIVNRQTGQNGQTYDQARDLGRVPMRRGELAEPVERFTIVAEPTGADRGVLRLKWDRSEFTVPFVVR